MNDVDFKHVAKAPVSRAVCRSSSNLQSYDRFLLLPGESYRDKASTLLLEENLSNNGPVETQDIAIGPSISEVGCSSCSTVHASISIDPDQLEFIIGKSISKAVSLLRGGLTLPLQSKLL